VRRPQVQPPQKASFDVFWTNALQDFGFGLAFTPMTILAFAIDDAALNHDIDLVGDLFG
jgi:hypothetical protein